MKPHEAITQLVAQFGESIVTEVRLANLLADLNGYQDYPAMKPVFRDMLKAGYGRRIYAAYSQDAQKAIGDSMEYTNEFVKETNYKEDLVSYGFDCLLLALGGLKTINEPLTTGFDPYSKGNGELLDNLDSRLAALQKQYLDLLDRLITLPQDIIKDAPGYYSTNALNKLYAVEMMIAVIIKQSDATVGLDWCKEKREEKLADYKKEKENAVTAQLERLKTHYLSQLASLIIIPKKLFVKRSGYYDEAGEASLSATERDIKLAYYNMGNDYDDWCGKEKHRYLSRHHVDSNKVALQLLGKIGIPAAVALGSSVAGVGYMVSADDIKQFEQTISLGEQKASAGDYGKALQLFSEAKTHYNGSFRAGHYEDIANEHIYNNVKDATQASMKMIEEGRLVDASKLLASLPRKVVAENKESAEQYNSAQSALEDAINDGLDHLIADISSGNGKLNEAAKRRLEELLKVNPNDYWLNFIKNKER